MILIMLFRKHMAYTSVRCDECLEDTPVQFTCSDCHPWVSINKNRSTSAI